MKVVIAALILSSFCFCLSAKPKITRVYRNVNSGKKNISMAYILYKNNFTEDDANPSSDVGKWLKSVEAAAQVELKKELRWDIAFEITDTRLSDEKLTEKLRNWTSVYEDGILRSDDQMHAKTILKELEDDFDESLNPDMICVLVKNKLYGEDFSKSLGHSIRQSLCGEVVPIILTYNPENVKKTGMLLSNLVKHSLPDSLEDWKAMYKYDQETFLDSCNLGYKLQDPSKSSPYIALPADENQYEIESETTEFPEGCIDSSAS